MYVTLQYYDAESSENICWEQATAKTDPSKSCSMYILYCLLKKGTKEQQMLMIFLEYSLKNLQPSVKQNTSKIPSTSELAARLNKICNAFAGYKRK